MKKIIFFITAMCLFAMHGCQKDIEAPINDIIIADKVSAAAKTATISGTVECPVSITKIELWIDSDENFSNHTVHDIKLSDKAFSILVNGLNINTTYYYKYVVYTAVDMAELDTKSFTTQSSGTNPGITVNFGGNRWEAALTYGLYSASQGGVAIYAYSDATGQKFPMFMSGLMIVTSGTYTDAVTEELGYANGIIARLEYWEAAYWTLGDNQYGDWWAKNATINVTELDLTAMYVSMNINATMFEFGDIVVWNEDGTSGTITPELLPNATTRSLSVNVTQVSLQSAKQSFNKKTISIVK